MDAGEVELGAWGRRNRDRRGRGEDRDTERNRRQALISPHTHTLPDPTRASQGPRPLLLMSSRPDLVPKSGRGPAYCPCSALSQPVSPDSGSKQVHAESSEEKGNPRTSPGSGEAPEASPCLPPGRQPLFPR